MVILSEPTTRDLVLYAVIAIILAVWGLANFTKIINKNNSRKARLFSIFNIIIIIIILIIDGILAYEYTTK